MLAKTKLGRRIVMLAAFSCLAASDAVLAQSQTSQQEPLENQVTRKIGTLKSIASTAIVMKPDSGGEVTAVVQDGARIARIAPGEHDLKKAAPATLQELQPGDRILVGGKMGSDGTLQAFSLVVIKQADLAQKEAREHEDWQKHGVGGIVKSIDPVSGDITIAITPAYSMVVKTSTNTSFLKYSEDSVKFADAKPSALNGIRVGDQLRARGKSAADQRELAAELVVSGSFRNIAGTLVAVDVSSATLTVKDVLAKKTVAVKVTSDSRLQKLPPALAQRVAALLKRPEPSSSSSTPTTGSGNASTPPDVQQLLSRAPAITLAEIKRDSAVIIISTPGNGNNALRAITLLSGVEPILGADSQGKAAAALLSSWNLSTALNDSTAPSQ